MLGLPDGVTACLFDLDGVLTQTAKVHAAAWKQTFDEYLRSAREKTGEEFEEFDPIEDYDEYVDGKPRYDGVRSFLESRGIELPEGSPDDPPDAETIYGIGNRKNELVLKLIKEHGVEAYEGSVRYVKAARDAGLRRAVVSSSANCQDVLVAAGIEDLFEARIDGIVADREHLKGKPAPDTFLAGARALGVAPAQAAVFEDALAGVQAGHDGDFGFVVGVDRVGQADGAARARRRRRGQGPGRAAATSRDRAPGVPGRAVGGPRDRAAPRQPRPDRVGVRAVQRPHRAARQPRRGRALRPARHLPRRLLRDPAAALRRGRLRLPRGRPDGGQRHQRQDHPPAGRGRAVRRPLRRAAQATSGCSTSATGCCAATVEWDVAHRPRRCASPRRGWCRSPSARWRRSSTWSRPSTADSRWSCSPSWWPTRRGRRPARTRAPRRRWPRRWSPSMLRRGRPAGDPRPPHPRERAADGGGDGPPRARARTGPRPTPRPSPTSRGSS